MAVNTAADADEDDGDAVLAKCESIATRLRSAAVGGGAAAWRNGELGSSASAFVTLEQACLPPPISAGDLRSSSTQCSCDCLITLRTDVFAF